MPLHFANRKTVAALDFRTDLDKVWLRPDMFSEREREQLVAALADYDGGVDADDLFSQTMEEFDGLAESPIEWWDLVDEAGAPQYQLWINGGDCAAVFRHDTIDKRGSLAQYGWDDGDDDLPALLAAAKVDTRLLKFKFD